MRRNDDLRVQRTQVVDAPRDQRLEDRPVEVKAADNRVQRPVLGKPAGVTADVHYAGVPASRDDQQALVLDVDDQRLVVEHQRIRLPAAVQPGLLWRESRLVAGAAGYLASDQHRLLEQEAGLAFLDDLEPGTDQRAAAG